MPCEQVTFLGAVVKNFNINVGWNTQVGTLTATVIEDPDSEDGNSFNPPLPGSPVFFEFPDPDSDFIFKFGGILQSWEEIKDISNLPAYEIIINDPREVLDDIQLITGGYHQTIGGIPNLFNVYGHLESIAFGGANVNDGGMAWNSILGSLIALGTGPSLWSGGINVQGYRYHVDLSNIPIVPLYLRVPGQSISLLSAIDFVCREAGADYYIELVEGDEYSALGTLMHTINIRIASRCSQPNLGAIDRFVTENCVDVSSYRKGVEFRNEITNAFLVGAQKDVLYEVTAATDSDIDLPEDEWIWPYWGINELGNAIISEIDFREDDDSKVVTVDARTLNAAGIGASYTMTLGEIRASLSGFDAWASYVEAIDPVKAVLLGLQPIWGKIDITNAVKIFSGKAGPQDAINFKKELAVQKGKRLLDEITLKSQQNVFQFVSNYASEYYGRKFMVRIPELLGYYQPETGIGITSLEPTDSGWPQSISGENIINNLGPYKPFFTNEQGKLECFVRFDELGPLEAELLDGHTPENLVTWGTSIFIRCQIDPKLVFRNVYTLDSPRVVITLAAPLIKRYEEDGIPATARGLSQMLIKSLVDNNKVINGKVLDPLTNVQTNLTPEQYILSKKNNILKSMNRMSGGRLYTGLGERPFLPDKAVVPLRSNIITYGPWYVLGGPGKTDFEKDDSLTPWNYGGISLLDTVARAKIRDKMTRMTYGEVGQITFVGAPRHQIGDVLIEGGPNVTGIGVQISDQGSLTNYRLRTFTPKFGSANKALIDTIQRLTQKFQAYDRNYRTQAFINKIGIAGPGYFNYRRNYILNNGPIGVQKGTPHEFMTAMTIADSSNFVSSQAASITGPEAPIAANAHDDTEYKNTSVMSTPGLFRGFSTDVSHTGIPHYLNPSGGTTHNIHSLNPFSGSSNSRYIDIDYIAHGDTYPDNGLQSDRDDYNPNKARPIGLRGPLVVAGWGYNQYGQPVPSSNSSSFLQDYKHRSNEWPTGPVDLRWDEYRNVWGGYVVHTARANGTMTRGGSGNFEIYTGHPGNNMFRTGKNVWAVDWMLASKQTIVSGTKCVLGYNGWNWLVMAAECTATTGVNPF